MKKWIFILISLTFIYILQSPVQAITLAPYKLEFVSEGGAPLTRTLTIFNEQKGKLNLKVFPMDILYDKKGKKSFKEPGTLKNSFARYISVSPTSFVLSGGEKKEVKVTLNIPKGIVGGTQAIILFQAMPDIPKDFARFRSALMMTATVGAAIFYENPLTVERKARIKEVKIEKLNSPDALNINLIVVNTGNTHYYSSAIIAVTGENDKYIGNISIPSKLILPDRDVILNGKWLGNLPAGQYHALITYMYADKNIVINKAFTIN